MKREKEIEEASVEYQMSKSPMALGGDAFADIVYNMNINPSFVEGAKWADKTMIEKACEWLEENLLMYWGKINANDTEGFIEEFRKAMEE